MLFASLALEREPPSWGGFPDAVGVWFQNAGAVAAFGIAIVLLARLLARDSTEWSIWAVGEQLRPILLLVKGCIILATCGYATLIALWLGDIFKIKAASGYLPRHSPDQVFTFGDWVLTISGIFSICIVAAPILVDVFTRISLERIFAIAQLSWKEAIRRRVVWVFASMGLVFLFADWFVAYKPEDQVRSYVRVVYWSMTPLFLLMAGLLGAFSIPTDVLNNSIHTIVTKPVEKIEVVLGRFLGYAALLTVGLLFLSVLSLVYVVRGVNEQATQESYKARVPIYGTLHFAGTLSGQKAQSVGREWGYRSYITGPTRWQPQKDRQYAIWDFAHIPADLGDRDVPILFEFQFDIFRLSKGTEGEGVFCSFKFTDGSRSPEEIEARVRDMQKETEEAETAAKTEREKAFKEIEAKAGLEPVPAGARKEVEAAYRAKLDQIANAMVQKYRLYQGRAEVTDYHTQEVPIPPSALKTLLSGDRKENTPALRVFVSVDVAKEAQLVGVARFDFYLLAYERPFWPNFLKGIVGMWCTHMIVLGVAIACSTYLSSIISLLNTMFLFLAGTFSDYLKDIAEFRLDRTRLDQGGPAEALMRITTRTPIAVRLTDSPTDTVIRSLDDVFSWWISRIMNVLPDVNRHDLHAYVANGFDIDLLDVLLLDNLLPLGGYLAPWVIMAYYLMKYREIANPQ